MDEGQATVGAVVSVVRTTLKEHEATFPEVSVAVAVMVYMPALKTPRLRLTVNESIPTLSVAVGSAHVMDLYEFGGSH